jgi:hypothetical protein
VSENIEIIHVTSASPKFLRVGTVGVDGYAETFKDYTDEEVYKILNNHDKLVEVLEKSKTFIEAVAELSMGKIKFDAERMCREIDEVLSEHLNRLN